MNLALSMPVCVPTNIDATCLVLTATAPIFRKARYFAHGVAQIAGRMAFMAY
jgi:hypothetical protein